MRFLVDESCDFAFLRALQQRGHDVLGVSSVIKGASDGEVVEFAQLDKRIVLTEDSDFGRLVYLVGAGEVGVIFLRYAQSEKQVVIQTVLALVEQHSTKLSEYFTVVQAEKVRMRRLPYKK